jgi:hypothetical protein
LFKWVNIPPGDKLHPWGPSSPLGTKFTPGDQVHPWGPSSPLGTKFTPGDQVHPWGASSPLGSNFQPGCKLPTWVQTSTLGANSFFLKYLRGRSTQRCPSQAYSWDRCYDLKNIGKKALFAQTTASFCKTLIITLFF